MDLKKLECGQFIALLDRYMDGDLSEKEIGLMKAHAEECEACALELKITEAMMETLSSADDDISVPLKAQNAWRSAVRKEIGKKKAQRRFKTLVSIAACAVAMVAVTFGMRSAQVLPGRYAENEAALPANAFEQEFDGVNAGMLRAMPATAEMVIESDGSYDEAEIAFTDEEVQIQSAVYSAESVDFDNDLIRLRELTEEYEGYVQQEMVTMSLDARVCTFVSRIPVELLDEYLTALVNIGKTVSIERFSENADLYYYDVEGRLNTKRETANRLNALISEASGEELSELNRQLEDVYAEIDELTGQASARENDLTYAKVTASVKEIGVATASEERSLSQRSASGFRQSMNALKDFFEDMVVSLAVIAPVLILVAVAAVLVLIAVFTVKRVKKNKKEESEK